MTKESRDAVIKFSGSTRGLLPIFEVVYPDNPVPRQALDASFSFATGRISEDDWLPTYRAMQELMGSEDDAGDSFLGSGEDWIMLNRAWTVAHMCSLVAQLVLGVHGSEAALTMFRRKLEIAP